MPRPAHARSVDIDVPFHDCDPLGIVWHGRYFEYFEAARTALLRSVQLDVGDVRELGVRLVVTDARCRYTFPLSCGEIARVTAWFTETTPLLRVAYEIVNVTRGRKSARAYTIIAATDGRGALLPRPPDALLDRLPTA